MGAVEASCWRGIERSHQRASRFCRLPLQWVFRGDLRQASKKRASIAIAAMMFRVWCKQVCVCVKDHLKKLPSNPCINQKIHMEVSLKIGVPPTKSSMFRWHFPLNRPSSYWVPMTRDSSTWWWTTHVHRLGGLVHPTVISVDGLPPLIPFPDAPCMEYLPTFGPFLG